MADKQKYVTDEGETIYDPIGASPNERPSKKPTVAKLKDLAPKKVELKDVEKKVKFKDLSNGMEEDRTMSIPGLDAKSVSKQASGGRVGCGAAMRGFGAVRKK